MTAPLLLCPECTADLGQHTAVTGQPETWYRCPDCRASWREDTSDPNLAAIARRDFFTADRAAARLLRRLSKTATSTARARLFTELAEVLDVMADKSVVWDNDRTDSDGFTPAEWITSEARLMRIMAITEHDPDTRVVDALEANNPLVRNVVNSLTTCSHMGDRAKFVGELYDAVVEQVGGQAAEILDNVECAYRMLQARVDGYRPWLPWTWRRGMRAWSQW